MADLIDRTELIRILRDEGLYYTALKRVIDSLPAVEVEAPRLMKELNADLWRLAKLNEALRQTNALLLNENKELQRQLEAVTGADNVSEN